MQSNEGEVPVAPHQAAPRWLQSPRENPPALASVSRKGKIRFANDLRGAAFGFPRVLAGDVILSSRPPAVSSGNMASRDNPRGDRNQEQSPSRDPRVAEFVTLLAVWQRRIFLYALSLLHDATNAEEVLQETNLTLWQKIDQYQPGTNFGHWAYRVAYYEVLKFRDKSARDRLLFSNECIELLAVEAVNSLEQADARRDAMVNCLGRMQPKHRELLVSRYQPGATTRSVAEALGRSVEGARQSLRKLRSKLLACIQRTLAAEERP